MKKNVMNLLGVSVITMATITSCKKDDAASKLPIVLTSVEAKNITADATVNNGHFAFYSLERNELVLSSDSASSKWDIAFKSTAILTNSGTSGPAAGGAFVQKSVSFDTYKTIPADSVFRTDNSATPSYAIATGSGNGWYNYDFNTNAISPIPGNVIVVRTASGKYAKLEILSYYKDAPASPDSDAVPRYYTFRFIYQPDGTKNF